jgi:hypothetical protein
VGISIIRLSTPSIDLLHCCLCAWRNALWENETDKVGSNIAVLDYVLICSTNAIVMQTCAGTHQNSFWIPHNFLLYFMNPFCPSPSESFIGFSLSNKLGFLCPATSPTPDACEEIPVGMGVESVPPTRPAPLFNPSP